LSSPAGLRCTDRGRPVARIIPHTGPNWVDAEQAAQLSQGHPDPGWSADIQQAHADNPRQARSPDEAFLNSNALITSIDSDPVQVAIT
jgi:antitoxin (DNA-binding transcriptional repressor) of toxin-antitoxin stability system